MKTAGNLRIFSCLSGAALLILCIYSYAETKNKKENYTEAKIENLKIDPEEYKRKDIFFVTRFNGFNTSFHMYMERSGFSSEKYYWLMVAPSNLPVMAKKRDFEDMDMPSLKYGMRLKLYGEVKKFTYVPNFREFTRYYFDLEKFEILDGDAPGGDESSVDAKDKKPGKGLPPPKLK